MNEETQINPLAAPIAQLPEGFICDKCQREFKSKPALTMHKIRKHGPRQWVSTGNFAGKAAKRRAYKKQYDLKKKAERTGKPPVLRGTINYCPLCGCNIRNVGLAVGFMGVNNNEV